jgi:cell division protein FtsZ
MTAPVAPPAPRPAPAPAPSRSRVTSLLNRIRGAEDRPAPAAAPAPAPAAKPAAAPRIEAPRASEPEQPTLSNLDPSERIRSSQADEDLLEIPAFLRRQAN